MGKPSAPTPPTPPSPSEMAAANAEAAAALTKLQRAMQFGEELVKDGYTREESIIPEGWVEKTGTVEKVEENVPTKFKSADGKAYVVYIGEDGKVKAHSDTINTFGHGDLVGKSWDYVKEKYPDWIPTGGQTVKSTDEEVLGFYNPDEVGEGKKYASVDDIPSEDLVPPSRYYEWDGDEKKEVTRQRALEADFTGRGDVDLAKMQWAFEQETTPERTEFLMEQFKKYGLGEGLLDSEGKPTEGLLDLYQTAMSKTDPEGYAVRKKLSELAQDYTPLDVPDAPVMQEMSGDFDAAERIGDAPTLGEIGDYYEGMIGPRYERAGSLTGFGGQQIAEGQAATQEEPLYGGEQPVFGGPPPDQIYYAGGQDSKATQAVSEGLERLGEVPKYQELNLNRSPELGRAIRMGELGRMGEAPTLERLEDIPQMEIDPDSLGARRFAEGQYLDRAQSGRTADLMADEARRIARTRAAATGNIFGGGALIEEARAVRQAEDAGQRQGLADLIGFLQSGQTASDYESRIAQQNLANRLMGIQQRTGAEQAEFGMGQQVLAQRNQAALQERADELAALGQRNQAEQQEFENIQASLAQINQARQTQFATDLQATEFNTQQRLRERADELATIAQRNQAQEAEYQNLLQALQQQQNVRTAEFGMNQQAIAQRNQAAEADFAKSQSALAQRNQARQQSFANAMQRTATQEAQNQQKMANLQSFSGLAPVSQQFGGGMAGAGQGMATTFNPIQYQPTNAQALLQGQQQLQANLFGTQSQNWQTQAGIAAQPSGFGQILGTVAGSFAGGVGEKAGAKWFE